MKQTKKYNLQRNSKEEVKPKPKDNKSTSDALSSILTDQIRWKSKRRRRNDNIAGDKEV
jgi:hypothetical protein